MFCFFLLFLSCGADAEGTGQKESDHRVTAVEEQEIEVSKLKVEIEIANRKLDCIPQIIERKVSEDCKKIIELKK